MSDSTTNADHVITQQRLDAPAFHRNIEPILTAFETLLPTEPAQILEVGSGTGQHIVRFAQAFPRHIFWPTEFRQENIASINAWLNGSGLSNVGQPVRLDAAQPQWQFGDDGHPPRDIDTIFCANVIHISPWRVAEGLLAGAARHLTPSGKLILYGPFRRDGTHTAPSNEAFDQWLKNQDPQWGVRDLDGEVTELARANNLKLSETLSMPSNNFLVSFCRT